MTKGHSRRVKSSTSEDVNKTLIMNKYYEMYDILENFTMKNNPINKQDLLYCLNYYCEEIKSSDSFTYTKRMNHLPPLLKLTHHYTDIAFSYTFYLYVLLLLLDVSRSTSMTIDEKFKSILDTIIVAINKHVNFWKTLDVHHTYKIMSLWVYVFRIMEYDPVNRNRLKEKLRNNCYSIVDKNYMKYVSYFIYYSEDIKNAIKYKDFIVKDGLDVDVIYYLI